MQPFDERANAAIVELETLIRQAYPDATFHFSRGQDDPEAIHLNAAVDLEDTDVILDLVMERMMEIQIEDEIPIFVIPTRPPERVRALLAATRPEPATASGSAQQS